MLVTQPTILQGPACVEFDGGFYFSKDGVEESLRRESNKTPSDLGGDIGETLKSQEMEISVTPVGERKNFGKIFPYNVVNLGKRIFNPGGAASKTLKIHTWEDSQTITYPRAALVESPTLGLGPNQTLFKSALKFKCLGDATKQPTDAAFWKTIAGADTWPAQFDETLVTKEVFKAAFGAAPYAVISALSGWEVAIAYGLKAIDADEVGTADYAVDSITCTAKGIIANLTPAQVDTLVRLQDATALRIGGYFAGATDLVIASDNLSITLAKCGAKETGYVYRTGTHRMKEVMWVNKLMWTAGVANPLFTIV
jgi:hypothetical protein